MSFYSLIRFCKKLTQKDLWPEYYYEIIKSSKGEYGISRSCDGPRGMNVIFVVDTKKKAKYWVKKLTKAQNEDSVIKAGIEMIFESVENKRWKPYRVSYENERYYM